MNKWPVATCVALIALSACASSYRIEDHDYTYLTENCKINHSKSERVVNGFVVYTLNTIECKNILNRSEYIAATCNKKCKDPVNRRRKYGKRKYIPNPVEISIELRGRNGENYPIHVPISCRCIRRQRNKKY